MTTSFTGHTPGTASYRRLLTGLFFAGVATFAQLYAPQAVLPLIAADLHVSPATAALSISAATLGLALAVIPWSLVADRIGRVPAMAIGMLAATALGIVAPLSPDIAIMLPLRFLEGIGLGAVPAIALAYLSEETDRCFSAMAAGGYIAGTTVGGLSGRLVAGPVADFFGWQAGVWTTMGLCAASALLFLLLVPAAQGFVPAARAPGEPGMLRKLTAPLRSGRQLVLYAQGFLLMGAFVGVYNYLGFHLIGPPFLLPVWLVTMLFLAYLAGTFSSGWAGTLASRHGRYPVLLGAILTTVAGAVLLMAPSTVVVLVGLLIFTAGFFGAHVVAAGWAPVIAPPNTRAQASSLYYFSYYVGSSLFGWLLGIVFGQHGWALFLAAVIAMCALALQMAVTFLRPRAAMSDAGRTLE